MGFVKKSFSKVTAGVSGYPTVTTYADLPDAGVNVNNIFAVTSTTGVWPFQKKAGLYQSNGSTWKYYSANLSVTLFDINRSYALNELCVGSDGVIYRSLSGSNEGNDPVSTTGLWIDITDQENTVKVAKEGGDYTTIKDALASITDASDTKPYSILVYPGIYSEDNPIQGKENITVKGIGGQATVIITAANSNENMFDLVGEFFLEDLVIRNVTGASNYAAEHLGTGACLLQNIIVEDCSNGVHINNSFGQFIINNLAIQGTTTVGFYQQAGNVTINSISIVGLATIGTAVNITGANSITTINNILAFSPNLTTGIFVQDQARVVAKSGSIIGMQDGIVLEGGCNFRGSLQSIFNAQQDGFRINDVGSNTRANLTGSIEDSTRYDLNILSSTALITGQGTTSIDKLNFVAGAELYGSIIDIKEDDEGFNILGELHVGLPEKGAESVFGEGDSYTRGMLVYTETDLGVFTDVSEDARSASASTFSFPGVAVDNAIYVASSLQNATDFLTHYGIKSKVETAAVKGTGSFIVEYWNGSDWTELKVMEVGSSGGYFPHADDIFNHEGGHHVRYDVMLAADSWSKNDPMELDEDYYWIRYRINNEITSSPVFEQFKLHTNRFEVNSDGFAEYYGTARPISQLPFFIGQDTALTGNLGNQTLFLNENIGAGLKENNFTTTTDRIGRNFFLPYDIDTSSKIVLKIVGRAATSGTYDFTIAWDNGTEGNIIYTGNPTLSPGARSVVVSKTVTAGEAVIFDFNLDVSNFVSRRDGGQPDFMSMSINASALAGNFAMFALEAEYVKWCEGGHVS